MTSASFRGSVFRLVWSFQHPIKSLLHSCEIVHSYGVFCLVFLYCSFKEIVIVLKLSDQKVKNEKCFQFALFTEHFSLLIFTLYIDLLG